MATTTMMTKTTPIETTTPKKMTTTTTPTPTTTTNDVKRESAGAGPVVTGKRAMTNLWTRTIKSARVLRALQGRGARLTPSPARLSSPEDGALRSSGVSLCALINKRLKANDSARRVNQAVEIGKPADKGKNSKSVVVAKKEKKKEEEDCEFSIAADLTLYANPLRCLKKTSKPPVQHPTSGPDMIAADLVKYGSPLDA